MVIKRNSSEGEGDGSKFSFQEPKRRYTSSINIGRSMHGLSLQELTTRLEPFIRVMVRDAVETTLNKFYSTSGFSINQTEPSEARILQLHFQSNLPSTLFTGSRIESEDNNPVKVVLVDANTKRIVDSGPLSAIKVEIIALNGDFNTDDQEDWSEMDFNSKIVHERQGKRPLVTGDVVLALSGGVGELGNIFFTDNSSWIRCRKFRLGAKVLSTLAGVRIKEAKSAPFVVLDHRGETYKKHYPPSLSDEIWRLEKIAKNGAFHTRLLRSGISTVKNFLQLYTTNSVSLRNMLGGGVSDRTWEKIIKHANTCVLDNTLYTYHRDEENIGLVLNSIYKVVAATFDGQSYQSLDKFNAFQMMIVEDLKWQAYKNLDRLVLVDAASIFGIPLLLPSLNQDQVQNTQLEVPMVQSTHSIQELSPTSRNNFISRDFCYRALGDEFGAGPSGSKGFLAAADGLSHFHNETSFFQGNNYYVAPTNRAVNDIVSPDGNILFSKSRKPKSRWCKIRAAIIWVSLRRDVAAKRAAQSLPYFDFQEL